MTTIGITGATGVIGGRVARTLDEALGREGALADQRGSLGLRLLVRDVARAPDADDVRKVSYADRASALEALRGVDVLLMVSAAEDPDRRTQHRTFVDVAADAGVGHLVYTSFAGAAPDATFTLGRDHADAEAAIADACARTGMTATLLRDNFYADLLPFFADAGGAVRGPAGSGRVAAVARADVADVATLVLAETAGGSDAHRGAAYTLTGPEALTLTEVAARATAVLDHEVRFVDETVEEAYASRAAAYPGTPDWQLDAWVSTYTAIADGSCAEVTDAVATLTGHPARTLEEALAEAAAWEASR
ncbi:NAD(P)H-binding protein [Nocardioides bruguierae]|uniref:NAD(P)H-binding protein n=1 Tax=Nocardioides bruguierae TaxID=2945102 RepID=UPI00202020E4|nr:NAD(P)H-binding protein [Nocardioides bruguierae]MCL8023814.1 NAD(P)H-binding protein [Nocardioides bruguierae]